MKAQSLNRIGLTRRGLRESGATSFQRGVESRRINPRDDLKGRNPRYPVHPTPSVPIVVGSAG